MESAGLIAYLALAALAAAISFALGLQTWEHRRYVRSCMRDLGRHHPSGRVAVFAPCKGIDTGFAENLQAILRQDYLNYEVHFVVESPADPAYAAILRAMAEHPQVATRLVIAGRATDCGQKVHNLRVATAKLGPEIDYVAFVDSDARPRPEWLRMLIARLDRPALGAVTGYRWFIPSRPSLANSILCSINSAAAVLLGPRNRYWVWGGSWATIRQRFEALGLPQAWQETISDDLIAGRQLRRAGLPTRFEPAALVASPLDCSWRQAFAFLRRQYLLGRYHVPGWWTLALLSHTLTNLAWLGTLAVAVASLAGGKPPLWIPLGAGAALWLLGAYRGHLRQGVADACFPEHRRLLRAARRVDIWATPLVGLVNWLAMLSSACGRHIRWRGVSYRMLSGGRIAGLHRAGEPDGDVLLTLRVRGREAA